MRFPRDRKPRCSSPLPPALPDSHISVWWRCIACPQPACPRETQSSPPRKRALLSGSGFAGRAHGLDSSGFRRVWPNRDPDRHPASRPSYRHTRTCSTAVRFRFGGQSAWLGFNRVSRGSTGSGLGSTPGVPALFPSYPDLFRVSIRPAEPLERDTRNKSGYDEKGAFGHGSRRRPDRRRHALPKPQSAPPNG